MVISSSGSLAISSSAYFLSGRTCVSTSKTRSLRPHSRLLCSPVTSGDHAPASKAALSALPWIDPTSFARPVAPLRNTILPVSSIANTPLLPAEAHTSGFSLLYTQRAPPVPASSESTYV